jgi:hypothetical protein
MCTLTDRDQPGLVVVVMKHPRAYYQMLRMLISYLVGGRSALRSCRPIKVKETDLRTNSVLGSGNGLDPYLDRCLFLLISLISYLLSHSLMAAHYDSWNDTRCLSF